MPDGVKPRTELGGWANAVGRDAAPRRPDGSASRPYLPKQPRAGWIFPVTLDTAAFEHVILNA